MIHSSMRRPPALWILLLGNTLAMLGVFFISPILPLYVGARGGSAFLVGAIMGSGMIARGIFIYPAGGLADRVGRKPVIVGAMFLYALGFLLYLLPLAPEALILVRFLHAAAAAFYTPAAYALLADLTPAARRGSAFGMMRASETAGMILGPVLGGLAAGFALSSVFAGGFVVTLVGTGVMLLLPAATARTEAAREVPHPRREVLARVLPMTVLGAAIGYLIGNYNATWSLYMAHYGATPQLIGLSYAVFGLPVVFLSPAAGRLSDRAGPWRAASVSVVGAGVFAATYGLVSSVPLLIFLGVFEGCATVAGSPALAAMVSRSVPDSQQGQAQGLFQLGQTAAQFVGSLLGGALYTVYPPLAFFSIAAVAGLAAIVAWPLQPKRQVAPVPAPAQ